MKKSKLITLSIILLSLLSCGDREPAKPTSPSEAMARSTKRGVAFDFSLEYDMYLLSSAISWNYNWGVSASSQAANWFEYSDIEYCPMCWGGNFNANDVRKYVSAHPNTRYLLAYNEPNLTDQANLTPTAAAKRWPELVALAKELNLKLVSPAMNYGTLKNYDDPIKWMDEFLAQPGVSLSDISAISLHCYMSSVSGLEAFIDRFRKYGKPIWLTEFCAWEPAPGSKESQMSYMCNALNYLEQEPIVARYAWFMPRSSKGENAVPYMDLLTSSGTITLTNLGRVFCGFSTFDKSAYLSTPVSASQYVALSNNSICVHPMEGEDGLYLEDLRSSQWADYHLFSDGSDGVTLKYSNYTNTTIRLKLDGKSVSADLPKTTGEWKSITIPMKVSPGAHKLRIEVTNAASVDIYTIAL